MPRLRKVKIRTPIWKSPRSVGIAERRFEDRDIIEVEIIYKQKDGKRLYPNIYLLTKSQALKYPIQNVKSVKLRIIPIKDLEIKNEKGKISLHKT